MKYHAYRRQAAENVADPDEWLCHEDWCETPEELREPLTRDGALELIEWDRKPGDRYRIDKAEEL